jgi:hypothetical protein
VTPDDIAACTDTDALITALIGCRQDHATLQNELDAEHRCEVAIIERLHALCQTAKQQETRPCSTR